MCAFKLEEPSSVGVTSKKKKEKRRPLVVIEKSSVSDATKLMFGTIGELQEQVQKSQEILIKQSLYSDIAYQISYRCRDISRDSLDNRPFNTSDIKYVMDNGWFRLDEALIIHNTALHACIFNFLEDQDEEMLGYYYGTVYEEIGFHDWEKFDESGRGKIVNQLYLKELANYLEMNVDLWDVFLAETDFVYGDFHVILFC